MTFQVPVNYRPLYSREQIAKRSCELGGEITRWCLEMTRKTGSDVIVMPILRGGLFFAADLVRDLKVSVDVVPIAVTSYDTNTNTQSDEVIIELPPVSLEGRAVLLIDDVCDTGRTLVSLTQRLMREGLAELKSVVVVQRILDHGMVYRPDWVGFAFKGNDWLVGYGLDDRDRFRNLPGIYTIA